MEIGRKKLTNTTPNNNVLEIVTAAIEDGTLDTDGPATAINGTDGSIRYVETGTVDNVRVQITYETLGDYDEWSDACKRYSAIMDTHGGRRGDLVLHGSETLSELQNILNDDDDAQAVYDIHAQYGGVPHDYAYYLNDESNNCDWDNPVSAEIID